MIWGCMGWNGIGVLTEVQGIMDAVQYCEILDGGIVESFEMLEMDDPDLNPIEHLWVYLKRKLQEYSKPPKGVHELWERVEEEWNKIPPETCQNLIASMPRRLQAVIRAKGGHTKY